MTVERKKGRGKSSWEDQAQILVVAAGAQQKIHILERSVPCSRTTWGKNSKKYFAIHANFIEPLIALKKVRSVSSLSFLVVFHPSTQSHFTSFPMSPSTNLQLRSVLVRRKEKGQNSPMNVVTNRDRTWQISSGTSQIVAPIFRAILILNLAFEYASSGVLPAVTIS